MNSRPQRSALGADGTRSAALAARAAEFLPGGVSSTLRVLEPPLVFVRGEGAHIWDADGRRYVDFHAAFGPIVLGHCDARVVDAAVAAVREMDLMGAGSTELEIALAEKIVEHVPSAEKVLFCNSGTEATYHAVRVARAVTGRQRLIKFQGCYHGWHDSLAANVISSSDKVGTLDPLSTGMLTEALASLTVLPFNDIEALEQAMARDGDEVAAVILEPVVHTIGCVLPTDDFLAALRRTTAEHETLLIFDEIVTGFRHHLGGYQAICGVTPDLTTLGKAIANGFPLAAICGRADVMDRFNTRPGGDVMYGGTFNGHPSALAASLATIGLLEAGDGAVYSHLYDLGARMRAGLAELADRAGLVARPAGFGSVFVCYFTDREVRSFDDALTNNAELYVGFHREMTERGFFMFPMNLKRNHVTAAHTVDDIDRALEAADEAFSALAVGARAGPSA